MAGKVRDFGDEDGREAQLRRLVHGAKLYKGDGAKTGVGTRTRAQSGYSANPSPAVTQDPHDAALADLFVKRHAGELRYVAAWRRWLHFDGSVWRQEATHLARDFAKQLCQSVAGNYDAKEARGIASCRTIAGVQTLAASSRKIAATVDQWDRDPWLLNTPDGVIDLRRGRRREHLPHDYMTKVTAVSPGGDCPLWRAFLDRIFANDRDLIAYVQRMLGYSLSGSTSEHVVVFGYGTGGNGKSVLIDTVAGILGDYHVTAPIETFTLAACDRHPTELARLAGARLVTAVETEQGRRWSETRIKTLTGGDKVAARFMRKDFFEFRPQFKLLVVGNHQPILRTVDEAIRRRFNLLPFAVTIPTGERDLALSDRLKTESPGILQWMIDGCIKWQRLGLKPPRAVTEATSKYLESQDAFSAWVAERCECKPGFRDTPSRLYASWKDYADRTGEEAGPLKTFGSLLEARGFQFARTGKARSYRGIQVRKVQQPKAVK